jgi:hypothetical protein
VVGKIKEIEVLSVVLEHLSDSIKYKEENNNSASVRSYTDAVFTLKSNGYSLESYGLRLDNLNSVDMESISPWEIFARIFAVVLAIISGFITFLSSRKPIPPIKSISHPYPRKGYGDIDSADKRIAAMKKTLHMVENITHLYSQNANNIIEYAKTNFEQVGILFTKLEGGHNTGHAVDEYVNVMTNTRVKHQAVTDQINNIYGLFINSVDDGGLVILSKGHDIADLHKLTADSIAKYRERKQAIDQAESVGPDLKFLRVRLEKNGKEYPVTPEEHTKFWDTVKDIDKKTDSFGKEIAIHLETLRNYVTKCKTLENRISYHGKFPASNKYTAIATSLSSTTKMLHDAVKDIMNVSKVLHVTVTLKID